MVKKVQYVDESIKPISLELEVELIKLQEALGKLETTVGLLQTGDKNGPYWNGENAYHFYKSCFAQIDHNYHLYDNLKRCHEYLDSSQS